MRIAIDARYLCEPFGSMTVFCGNLMRSLAELDFSGSPVALIPRALHPSAYSIRDELANGITWVTPDRDRYLEGGLRGELWWVHWAIPSLLARSAPDVNIVIMTYHHPPAFLRGVKRVAVVHDLCGLGVGFPKYKKAYWRHYIRLRAAAHLADAIWPVSQCTSDNMAARFRSARRRLGPVVYNGVDRQPVTQGEIREIVAAYGLEHDDYVIAFATWQDRKNFAATLAALTELQRRGRGLRLVGIAPAGQKDGVREWCLSAGHSDAVILSGLSDRELDGLYGGALALVWPSICEGFGYPVVEAMKQGCPPCVWEVGPGAELVNGVIDALPSLNPRTIADKLDNLRSMDDTSRSLLRRKLRSRSDSFSIQAYQERLEKALGELDCSSP